VIRFWLWARRFFLVTLFRIVCSSFETPWPTGGISHPSTIGGSSTFWRKLWTRLFNHAKYLEWVAVHRRVKLELAEIFLLLARESRDRIRPQYLTQARELLGSLTGQPTPASWEESRRLVVEWDYKIRHPH